MDSEDIQYIDDLVQEYLTYRGFSSTSEAFARDKKKLKTHQTKRLVADLFLLVHDGHIDKLLELWSQLDKHFFSRVDGIFFIAQELSLSLKRYYVIYAVQTGQADRVFEFFKQYSHELASDKEWRTWFVLPYLKNPKSDQAFSAFFEKSWLEKFKVSLYNFLSIVFQSLPVPKILNFNVERKIRLALQSTNGELINQNAELNTEIEKLNRELERFKLAEHNDSKSLEPDQPVYQQPSAQLNQRLEQNSQHSAVPSVTNPVLSAPQSQDQLALPSNPETKTKTDLKPDGAPLCKDTKISETTATTLIDSKIQHFSSKLLKVAKTTSILVGAPIVCCKYSCDGNSLAFGTHTGFLHVRSSKQKTITFKKTFDITALEWNRSGHLIFSGTGNGIIKLWDVDHAKNVGKVSITPHQRISDIVCPLAGNFISCSTSGHSGPKTSGTVQTVDLRTLQLLDRIELDAGVNSIIYNHNASMALLGMSDGYIRIFDLNGLKPIMSWKGHNGSILNAKYAYDETNIYSIDSQGMLLRWCLQVPGKIAEHYSHPGNSKFAKKVDMSFDESGKYFITSSKNNFGYIYYYELSHPILGVGDHTSPILCSDWNPGQNQVATGCLGGVVCLSMLDWDDQS